MQYVMVWDRRTDKMCILDDQPAWAVVSWINNTFDHLYAWVCEVE